MIYTEFQPDTLLNDFVKCYWCFDNTKNQQLDFTILPDGCFDLIISFDNNLKKGILLTGLWTKQINVSVPTETKLFAIRFRLLAAEYLLQQNIAILCDTKTEVQLSFWQLEKLSFEKIENAIELLNQLLLSILKSGKGIDERKRTLFKLLYQTNGNLSIAEYSKTVFWTSRQINRYFNERFGLSLKAYCNILKCHASFKDIKNGQLFPQGNYFDQSHFIKEIQKHTGQNPGDLYHNKNDRFLQLATMIEK